MRITPLLIATALVFIAPIAAAAEGGGGGGRGGPAANCSIPEEPVIPEGGNSSEQEMVAAQGAMKAFIADGETYIECLKNAEANSDEELSPEYQASMVASHNAMVDAMQGIADKFNVAVRAYKAAN